jgi:hypothetical protein
MYHRDHQHYCDDIVSYPEIVLQQGEITEKLQPNLLHKLAEQQKYTRESQ